MWEVQRSALQKMSELAAHWKVFAGRRGDERVKLPEMPSLPNVGGKIDRVQVHQLQMRHLVLLLLRVSFRQRPLPQEEHLGEGDADQTTDEEYQNSEASFLEGMDAVVPETRTRLLLAGLDSCNGADSCGISDFYGGSGCPVHTLGDLLPTVQDIVQPEKVD